MAVNLFTNGAGGNTWNTAGNWSQGTIPTATDGHVTTFDATSPNCTMGAARSCNNIDFTGYTNTLTMSSFTLTVAGNVTLDTGMGISGTGVMVISATSTITSNGKAWPNSMNWTGASQTITLVGNLSITGLLTTSGNPSKTVNNTTSEILYLGGGLTATTYAIVGTVTIELTGGTLNGEIRVDLRLNGNITFGTVIWGIAGKTLTHVSGTLTISTLFTIYATSGVTLDTGSIVISALTLGIYSGTQAVTLLSTLKVTTLTIATYNITYSGSFGFEVGTYNVTATSAVTHTLTNGVEYKITSSFHCYNSRTESIVLFTSDHASIKALLTVSPGAECRLLCNMTRIDASGGRPLRAWNGTITDCNNVVSFYDLKTAT